VTLSERSHGWGSNMIEFFALGTAIVATDGAPEMPSPMPVLDLGDR
jgi:hypothetical protein